MLRYVRAIRRRVQYVLLAVILVPCAAVVGLSFMSPKFESSSVILYEEKLPFAREMGEMIVQRPEESYRDTERLSQIEARLKSALFLRGVVQQLNIAPPGKTVRKLESARPPGVASEEFVSVLMADALRKSIRIAEMGPDLFKITVAHPDRDEAFLLTDGITNLFMDYVTKGQVADIRAAGTFSEDQLPVYEQKLRESEERLKQLRAQAATRAAREGSTDQRSIESARATLSQTDAEIAELEGNRKTSRETMDASYPNAVNPVTLIRGAAISDAYSQVVRNEESSVSLLIQGVSTSSAIERVGLARERLLEVIQETVRNTLRGSPDALVSLVSEQVYDDYVIRSLERRRSLVSAAIGQYSRAAGRKPQDEMEIARLEQEVEANNTVLQSLRRQLTSSRISEAAQSTRLGVRIEVIEPATRPLNQAGPAKLKILVLACLLGPFLGLSFAVLSEYIDDSVKSVEDVTRGLGLPVLGTIPRVPGEDYLRATRARRWPYIVILATIVLTAGVRLGHEPLLRLFGKTESTIEIRSQSEGNRRTVTGNEQAGEKRPALDQR